MKPPPFQLHRPASVEDALSSLAELADEGGLILAGGQSLVPMMALRVAYPPHLIDINAIAGLDRLTVQDGALVIGATVRHASFHRPVIPNPLGRLLAAMSRHIAHYPIRMRGTFCGSLAHADPASEWCLAAATLGAEVTLATVGARRIVSANAYFTGAMTTVREPNEMLLDVRLPLLPEAARFGFYEFNRRAGDYALGMCLAVYDLVGGVMTGVRVGIGGVEAVPRRLPNVERQLEGQRLGDAIFADASAAAAEDLDPLEDPTTSAEYRRDLTSVVVRRALAAANTATDERGGDHV